jgi:hypothetical protein
VVQVRWLIDVIVGMQVVGLRYIVCLPSSLEAQLVAPSGTPLQRRQGKQVVVARFTAGLRLMTSFTNIRRKFNTNFLPLHTPTPLTTGGEVQTPPLANGVGRAPCMNDPPLSARAFWETVRPGACYTPVQRWVVTPTCRHMSSTGQIEQRGRVPVQMCLPNGTSRRLISTQ